MRPVTFLGIAAIGGTIAYRYLPADLRDRFSRAMERRMSDHMDRAMDRMPEDAPPKLVRKIVPKLEEQNEEILALLREQNALLKAQRTIPA